MAMLRKLLPPTGVAATFDDERLRVGTIALPGRRRLALFNWTDEPVSLTRPLPRRARVIDFWSGAPLGELRAVSVNLPARSARLLECVDA
jgi:alpha-galactosidase